MERRTGTTTRLVDKYIQMLFNDNVVAVWDDYDGMNKNMQSNYHIFRIFLRRLEMEHDITHFDIDKNNFIVKLKDEYIRR